MRVALIAFGILCSLTLFFLKQEKPRLHPEEKFAVEPSPNLGKQYCITYGKPEAAVQTIEFFSFQCPHCIRLFKEEFPLIKKKLIDTGKMSLTFHPVPQDLTTLQALICLEHLSEKEKQWFLEALLEEAEPSRPELTAELMKTAMQVFKKPIPSLEEESYLQNHPVFEKAYQFLKQEKVLAIPSVEINGHLYASEIPDFAFLNSFTQD
jgi:protein-disulfide isomerase